MNPKHERRETLKSWKTRAHYVCFLSETTKSGRQGRQERGRESDRGDKNVVAKAKEAIRTQSQETEATRTWSRKRQRRQERNRRRQKRQERVRPSSRRTVSASTRRDTAQLVKAQTPSKSPREKKGAPLGEAPKPKLCSCERATAGCAYGSRGTPSSRR